MKFSSEQMIKLIQEVRQATGLGILEARKALQATDWDFHNAIQHIRKELGIMVDSRSKRATNEGIIDSYIHVGNKIGVLVEVNTETDFVARNDEFKQFVRNLCMQIAATNPTYVSKEDVPFAVSEKERELAANSHTCLMMLPAARAKFIGGCMDRFYSSVCLLEQVYVKDRDKTVLELVNELGAKFKENIRIRRFTRYHIGA